MAFGQAVLQFMIAFIIGIVAGWKLKSRFGNIKISLKQDKTEQIGGKQNG